MIIGDLNAKIRKEKREGVTGVFEFGELNEREEMLSKLCTEDELVFKKTFHHLPHRKLYTWKSPQDNPKHIGKN